MRTTSPETVKWERGSSIAGRREMATPTTMMTRGGATPRRDPTDVRATMTATAMTAMTR